MQAPAHILKAPGQYVLAAASSARMPISDVQADAAAEAKKVAEAKAAGESKAAAATKAAAEASAKAEMAAQVHWESFLPNS
jgi:hypothetical protein